MSVASYTSIYELIREHDFHTNTADGSKSFGHGGEREYGSGLMYGYFKIDFNTLLKTAGEESIEQFLNNKKAIMRMINSRPRGRQHSSLTDTQSFCYFVEITDGQPCAIEFADIVGKKHSEIHETVNSLLNNRQNNVNATDKMAFCSNKDDVMGFIKDNLFISE